MTNGDVPSIDSFTAVTPNGIVIVCPASRWASVVAKHPVLRGQAQAVRDAIQRPVEIRRSRSASDVWLCYRAFNTRLVCAVIASRTGTLLTAYPTDAMKPGDRIWIPSE